MNRALLSSGRDEWATPPAFFAALDREFWFDLDVCALPHNAKCPRFFTPEDDGLRQRWDGRVWCNPPYSTAGAWIRKAWAETLDGCPLAVLLLAARPDTAAFHRYILNNSNVEVRWLKGRITFAGARAPAPFPSAVVIFHPPGRPARNGATHDHD